MSTDDLSSTAKKGALGAEWRKASKLLFVIVLVAGVVLLWGVYPGVSLSLFASLVAALVFVLALLGHSAFVGKR
jgi:hypothetical protein